MDSSGVTLDVDDHLLSLELSDIISLSELPESTLPVVPRERDHGKESSVSSERKRKKSSRETHDVPYSELQLQMTQRPRKQKSRTSQRHNLSEKKRRDRIKAKMKVLRELIPNSQKLDKASLLDRAISHVKALKKQLQVMQGMSLLPYQSVPVGTLQCPGTVEQSPFVPQATPNVGLRTLGMNGDMSTTQSHLGVPFCTSSLPSVVGFFSMSTSFLPVNPFLYWPTVASTSMQQQMQQISIHTSYTSISSSSIFIEETDETVNENENFS